MASFMSQPKEKANFLYCGKILEKKIVYKGARGKI
jgi:hypothetical protein